MPTDANSKSDFKTMTALKPEMVPHAQFTFPPLFCCLVRKVEKTRKP